MTVIKENFLGGMQNQFSSEKSDFAGAYALAVNVRVRQNVVEPVKEPVEIELPAGTLQGLYTFDNNILVFISGVAYYRKTSAVDWTAITGFAMSASATRIWAEPIPGSSVNFVRKTSYAALDFTAPTTAQPAAVICCDGITQPYVIFPDGSARKTKTWAAWSTTDREYVPIGKLPMFFNGKLYMVVKDTNERFTQIVSSVSGRPLDFVTLVNNDGDKGGTAEREFGAYALRFNVSYDEITALSAINQPENQFIVTTARATFSVTQDLGNLIAGEPTHTRKALFNVGSFGPEAIVDLNGDIGVVYPGGIRTFNGVSQLRWEGKNAPLNRQIQNLVTSDLQTSGATCWYDNYTGFAVSTKYGSGVVWWDQTIGVFVAVDIFQGVSLVKQFATVITPSIAKLYFWTDNNKLYEAFAGDYPEAQLTLHDATAGEPNPLAVRRVQAAFLRGSSDGYIAVDLVSDGTPIELPTKDIRRDDAVTASRVGTLSDAPPSAALVNWLVGEPMNAYRVTPTLRWTGGAKLSRVLLETEVAAGQTNTPDDYSVEVNEPVILAFIADDGVVNATRTALNRQIRSINNLTAVIGAGDHAYETGTQLEVDTNLAPFWGTLREAGQFYAVPGNHDLGTSNGAALYQFLRQTPTRYSVASFGAHCDVFLFNSGFTTAGAQVDPDNLDGATLATSTQAKWLISALEASTARTKIVVWHHPAYTSSSSYYGYSIGVQMQALATLVARAGATAIISGHAHMYERLFNEIPHFTVGTGGAALVSAGATLAVGSQKTLSAYGYLRVTASPLRCKFEFIDTDGTTRDTFCT